MLNLLLKAVHHFELRHFTHEPRLLILNQTLRIFNKIAFAIEIHQTHKLLLLVPDGATLVYHSQKVACCLIIFRRQSAKITLEKVSVHHHHIRVEIFSFDLELLRCYLLSLFNGKFIELRVREIPRLFLLQALFIIFLIIIILLLVCLDCWWCVVLLLLGHYIVVGFWRTITHNFIL